MSDMSLTEVENAQNEAYGNFFSAQEGVQAAEAQSAAAAEAYCEAQQKFMNGEISQEEWEAAGQAVADAEAAEKAANEKMETAAAEAEAAAKAVEEKKQELRDNRENDTSYVVHCARIECPYGMRESYLALGPTHGVLSRQIPQMTAKDILLDTNIINFGGCHSKENPKVQEAIEKVTNEANAIIEEKKDWRDKVVDYVTSKVNVFKAGLKMLGIGGKDKEESEEDKVSECVGECIAQFATGAEWSEGHEKVFINGEPVLLRKCSIMCNYGGCITILVNGQPE